MELTNKHLAMVDKRKLSEYLLSDSHPVGRAKAKYLRGLGFDSSNVQLLERGLLQIAGEGKVIDPKPTRRLEAFPVSRPRSSVEPVRLLSKQAL